MGVVFSGVGWYVKHTRYGYGTDMVWTWFGDVSAVELWKNADGFFERK